MGGEIRVKSALGAGSSFRFTLPLRKSASFPSNLDNHDRLVNLRTLIVNDNPASGQFIHEQIVAWKMRNDLATTGAEALNRLRKATREEDPYRLGIIDQQMLDMDGMAEAKNQ
jgi:two-component system sensor histidine kinase/response regulator